MNTRDQPKLITPLGLDSLVCLDPVQEWFLNILESVVWAAVSSNLSSPHKRNLFLMDWVDEAIQSKVPCQTFSHLHLFPLSWLEFQNECSLRNDMSLGWRWMRASFCFLRLKTMSGRHVAKMKCWQLKVEIIRNESKCETNCKPFPAFNFSVGGCQLSSG